VRVINYTGDLKGFIRTMADQLNLNVIFDRQSFAQPRSIDGIERAAELSCGIAQPLGADHFEIGRLRALMLSTWSHARGEPWPACSETGRPWLGLITRGLRRPATRST